MPSTAIQNFAYDPARRELSVTFTSGRRYLYVQVPPDIFTALGTAPSRGAYFNQHIRDHYTYREITGSGADRN